MFGVSFVGGRVLLVASWGLPAGWREVEYWVSVKHRAFEEFHPVVCRARSSTVAIAAALLGWGYDVDVVIYGADTIVNPGEVGGGVELRRRAQELYLGFFEEMVRGCSCCSGFSGSLLGRVDIVVVPGLGLYHGYRFGASIEHIFNKVFIDLYARLGRPGEEFKWVFMDLTHGVNYQVVATLYATIAAAILFGKEGRVVILNSMPVQSPAPATRGGGTAQVASGQVGEVPVVEVADVSQLQYGISFIRGLMSLKNFDTEPVKEVHKDLKKRGGEAVPEDVLNLIDRAVTFLNLVRNGMAALAYPESYMLPGPDTENRVKLGFNVCEELSRYERELDPAEFSYIPNIDRDSKVVDYGKTSMWTTLTRYSLTKVLKDICGELRSPNNLAEFLEGARKALDKRGYKAVSLMVKRENENLNSFIKNLEEYVRKCGKLLRSYSVVPENIEESLRSGSEVDVNVLLYRYFNESRGECVESISKVLEIHENEVKDVMRIKEMGRDMDVSRVCRNLAAHAGLEYSLVRSFSIVRQGGEVTITRVLYLENISEIAKKCLE